MFHVSSFTNRWMDASSFFIRSGCCIVICVNNIWSKTFRLHVDTLIHLRAPLQIQVRLKGDNEWEMALKFGDFSPNREIAVNRNAGGAQMRNTKSESSKWHANKIKIRQFDPHTHTGNRKVYQIGRAQSGDADTIIKYVLHENIFA